MQNCNRKQHYKHFVKTREVRTDKSFVKEKTEYLEVKTFFRISRRKNKTAKYWVIILINILLLLTRYYISHAYTV